MTKTQRWLLASGLTAASFLAGYGIRAYAEGAPKQEPLFYSGVLEVDGEPAEGPHDLTLSIHDAVTGGNQLCMSEYVGAEVDRGHFRVALPDTCVTALRQHRETYLQVGITGPDKDKYNMPRVKLGAVPYALEADRAATAQRASSAATADSAAAGANNFRVNGDATVTGTLRVGTRVVTTCIPGSEGIVDCNCAPGEVAISGGGFGGNGHMLSESRQVQNPNGTTGWRVACANANGSRLGCAQPHAICVRLGN
jgi:hypothetical protein